VTARMSLSAVALLLSLSVTGAARAAEEGLAAQYDFSEGTGTVLKDLSGNGNDGAIHGATWVARKQGHALWFDGENDYVDCGARPGLDLRTSVTVEVWVKTEGNAGIDAGIAGKHFTNYSLTSYKGRYWWYISGGGNNIPSRSEPDSWKHVVGTFDGKIMSLYVDGKLVESKPSKAPAIAGGGNLHIGCIVGDSSSEDPAQSESGYFHGTVGQVRVYSRALSLEEVQKHYVAEAGQYVDASRLDKLALAVYPYFTNGQVVAEVDWSALLSVPQNASIQLQLALKGNGNPLMTQHVPAATTIGYGGIEIARAEVTWSTAALEPGDYVIRASLGEKQAERMFTYADSAPRPPSPDEKTAAPLPGPLQPVAYDLRLSEGGGFSLVIAGREYPFESWYSYPHGGENKLAVSATPDRRGEDSWSVSSRRAGETTYAVRAAGQFYVVDRQLTVLPNRVAIRDTFTNRTKEDLGIIIQNHLKSGESAFRESYLAGYKCVGVRRQECSPSVFVAKEGLGIGVVPVDDVYIVQSEVYCRSGLAGVSTSTFALAPEASCTLEWAVYPNRSGDYYDFVNAFRKDEGRIGTVEGGLDFANRGMDDRTLRLTPDFVQRRNLKYATLMGLAHPVDDPSVSIEGIEFVDFPKEMAVIKEKMTELHAAYPGLMGMFHVAHSLYTTNKPEEKFPDSRVIGRDGKQPVWEEPSYSYMSKERQEAGWKWWIFYPTPGNSFHDALMRSVDVMMDDLGCRGVFTDGLMSAYMGAYTYDRWDGHTAEIDPNSKTIKRKMGSVLLLSQPSVVEFVRKINAKGGVVIANNCVMTRTFAREKVIVNRESICPDPHFAPTVICLGTPAPYLKDGPALYRDILKTLDYGSLYFLCNTGPQVSDDSIVARMYPITCEEIHSGIVKGPERIITARSGVYGWRESADLPFIYAYDGRGVRVPHAFISTADSAGVRTQVDLAENESAVLRRIPVAVRTKDPVNVLVTRYDRERIRLLVNGRGKVDIRVADGEFAIRANSAHAVRTSAGAREVTSNADRELSFSLALQGALEVTVE